MTNLVKGDEERTFFVWVNPDDFLVQHQVGQIGSFTNTPTEEGQPTLMFLPNPEFKTFISPFQNNLVRLYAAEYNLEIARAGSFRNYPSRLHAIFLLDSEENASGYGKRHPEHVGGRILKRAKTSGSYVYSVHDSSWIDFLRLSHSIDQSSLDLTCRAYWSGQKVEQHHLESMGKSWNQEYLPEMLFLGRIDFDDRTLVG
jgi:hypothetical protein